MITVTIDYSQFGKSRVVTVPLLAEERSELRAGSFVIVEGDGVCNRTAEVEQISADGREARLRFCDAPSQVGV